MNTIERVNKKKVDVSQFSQNFTKEKFSESFLKLISK